MYSGCDPAFEKEVMLAAFTVAAQMQRVT